AEGERVQLNSSRGERSSRAAAWSSACRAVRVLPSQNPPDSTPPVDRPVADARPVARIIAVSGSWQPRTGDQRRPAGRPSASCCGSKPATGPCLLRARVRHRLGRRSAGRTGRCVMTGYADFEQFVIARRAALLRTAYLLTGNPHDAEDLVQTA